MRVSLNGDNWTLERHHLRSRGQLDEPVAATQTTAVAVPGNIQVQMGWLDLWTDDPALTSLNHDEWVYRTTFAAPDNIDVNDRAYLCFDGVDYFCDIWLNGCYLGHHEGAYSTFEFDVTGRLRPFNRLVVAVSCPWRVDERSFYLEASTPMGPVKKHTEYMKGNLLHYWDGLPLSGHAVFPFGLWNDVSLEVRRPLHLKRLSVSTETIAPGSASMTLACEWSNAAPEPTPVAVVLEVQGLNHDEPVARIPLELLVPPGECETRTGFSIDNPRLWWTWDTGEQALYAASATVNGQTVRTRFGIRLVARDPETLAYSINGQRLYIRGVWYPFANIFNALPSDTQLRRDATMLREANVNHIVVFTFIEKSALYDACDEAGILIFQELPFTQFGPMNAVAPEYPRREEYWSWSLDQIANIVRQRRSHPSVMLWSPFAETRKEGAVWRWGDYTEYVAAIQDVVVSAHPDALFHASFCDFEEEHIWNGGFPFGEFWDHYGRDHRFISEFGAVSPPVLETLEEIMPPGAIWDVPAGLRGRTRLPIDVAEYAYRWAFDYPGLATSVARMYRHMDRAPRSLRDFVDAVQGYQSLGLRYCAEAYRRRRFDSIAGSRTWSYRENVPGIKFTVVDHRQRPKAGYFGLKAGYEPLLLSLDERLPLKPRLPGCKVDRDLWLVNDTTTDHTVSVQVSAYLPDGCLVSEEEFEERAIASDSGQIVGRLSLELPTSPGPVLLRMRAKRPDGSVACSSESWVRVSEVAFSPELRVLLLGQDRFNAPIVDALDGLAGIALTIVDETTRNPQDSSWALGLAERFDVVWFTGWETAGHFFRECEFAAVRDAVASGCGFIHTGGQASFHGGDGRGALLDVTPLKEVLPVHLLPHDTIWDHAPDIRCGPDNGGFLGLDSAPAWGFSRTRPAGGSTVHWWFDEFPLLATGTFGDGRTVAYMGSLTRPLRIFRISEGLEWEDPLATEPHWTRDDITAYSPHWKGTLELALASLSAASGQCLSAPLSTLADLHRRPLFESLSHGQPTALRAEIVKWSVEPLTGETIGLVMVTNIGTSLAHLVRGRVHATTLDHRFRDGFVDLLPGESAELRFEASCAPEDISVELSATNAASVTVALAPTKVALLAPKTDSRV